MFSTGVEKICGVLVYRFFMVCCELCVILELPVEYFLVLFLIGFFDFSRMVDSMVFALCNFLCRYD